MSIALVFSSIGAKADDNSERQRQLQKKHDELLHKVQNTNVPDIENYVRYINYHNKTGTYFPNQIPISKLDNKTDELVLRAFVDDYLNQKKYYQDKKQKKPVDRHEKPWESDSNIGNNTGYFLGAFSTKDLKRPLSELCELRIPKIHYQSTELISPGHTLEQLLGKEQETKIYEISALHLRDYLNKISQLRNKDPLLPKPDKEIGTSVAHFFMSWTGKKSLGEQLNRISVTKYENGYTLELQPLAISKRGKQDYDSKVLIASGDVSKLSLIMKCIKEVEPEPFAQIPTKYERFKKAMYALIGTKIMTWFMKKN